MDITFEEYKNKLLAYLTSEKELTEEDIQNHLNLSDEEKVAQGYLIKDCHVSSVIDDCYELIAIENNTKLRAGDKVILMQNGSQKEIKATIIENFFSSISLIPQTSLDVSSTYSIEVAEAVLLDPLIKLLTDMEDGSSGSSYIKELCKNKLPKERGVFYIDSKYANIPNRLNEAQHAAIENVLARPSLYCIQGPPGTGKTDVLSEIAKCFSTRGYEVLIVSNTHQAVNNALNKIGKNSQSPLVKIGEALKAKELLNSILQFKSFRDYMKTRPRKRTRYDKGAIVGMTLHAAIINLGLQKSGFSPAIVLVDEAGQIPLSFGAAIGTFGSGSIVFIGDDRQMPPIFHPSLIDDEMSVSIFTHITSAYPNNKIVLDTTYRMNTEITSLVSKHFYEPYGIVLKSNIAPIYTPSVEIYNNQYQTAWTEYNPDEAKIAAKKALEYTKKGLEVALVTPFRKQVNCIRKEISDEFKKYGLVMPLVDTVERLQGQDVDVIILSFSIADEIYYRQIWPFVEEPHRLNVMISRAKQKVIILKSNFILKQL